MSMLSVCYCSDHCSHERECEGLKASGTKTLHTLVGMSPQRQTYLSSPITGNHQLTEQVVHRLDVLVVSWKHLPFCANWKTKTKQPAIFNSSMYVCMYVMFLILICNQRDSTVFVMHEMVNVLVLQGNPCAYLSPVKVPLIGWLNLKCYWIDWIMGMGEGRGEWSETDRGWVGMRGVLVVLLPFAQTWKSIYDFTCHCNFVREYVSGGRTANLSVQQ